MKLTTKRDRWYFWRELFQYMIPMILIVGTVDVFFNFMQCPLHPEYSAPCNIIWVNAVGYGIFLIITIIFAIFSAKKLKKVKKKIEAEFMEAVNHAETIEEKGKGEEKKSDEMGKVEGIKPKKVIAKSDKKESTKKITKKETKRIDKNEVKRKEAPAKRKATKK